MPTGMKHMQHGHAPHEPNEEHLIASYNTQNYEL